MVLIIYGTHKTSINIDEFFIKCPCCETHSWADIMVSSKYYHFYMLPFFPVEKEADVICKKCGIKRYGISFDSSLISNYDEVKGKFKHPLFTYTGLGIIAVIFLAAVLHAML